MTVARFRMYLAAGIVVAGFVAFIVCVFLGRYFVGFSLFLAGLVLCGAVRPNEQIEAEVRQKMAQED